MLFYLFTTTRYKKNYIIDLSPFWSFCKSLKNLTLYILLLLPKANPTETEKSALELEACSPAHVCTYPLLALMTIIHAYG